MTWSHPCCAWTVSCCYESCKTTVWSAGWSHWYWQHGPGSGPWSRAALK